MTENKMQENKEPKKKIVWKTDTIIKIITGIIMLGIVVFLVNKNSAVFDELEDVLLDDTDQVVQVQPVAAAEASTISQVNQGVGSVVPVEPAEPAGQVLPQVNPDFKHTLIGAAEYKEKLDSGDYVHIDIRTQAEYDAEKIADGLNIDFYETDFAVELSKLDKSKKYIYHCRSGSRSANSVPIFKELGFGEIYELDGGINSWKQSYPTK